MFAGPFAAALVALLSNALVTAEQPVSACPADPGLSRLVANSDLIVVGRLRAPINGHPSALSGYVDIPGEVVDSLKGAAPTSLEVRALLADQPYRPSNAALTESAGSPVLLFLDHVDESPAGYYFAGYSPSALTPASVAATAATVAEIERQNQILKDWHSEPTLPHDSEVRGLLARLGSVRGAEQQAVFSRLEALGADAVPAIIARMDDRRRLADPRITLINRSPDAFEGARNYGPQQVVDALDAVLNQITGESFGTIMNGGSDAARAASVAGWRIYAADLACPKADRSAVSGPIV